MTRSRTKDSSRGVSPRIGGERPDDPSTTRRVWLAVAVLAVIVCGVYANSFQGVFVLDDHFGITDNPNVKNLWPPGPNMLKFRGMRLMPDLTLAINWSIGGSNPLGYHAVNLAIHLLAAMAMFGIVRRTLRTPRLAATFGSAATALAFVVAMLWAIHPLTTSAVTYIVQRAESLMGMFYLLTIYCVIRSFASARAGWSVAAVLCCLLGMVSKQVMSTAPLVALVYARLFLADSFAEILRRRWGLFAGLAGTWLVLGALMLTFPTGPAAGGGESGLNAWSYLRLQLAAVPYYIRLSLWPNPLCLDYYKDFAGPQTTLELVGLSALLAGLLAMTVWGLIRRSAASFAGVWFFVILAPTSSVIPIADAVFEHRMYLSLAAVTAFVILGGYSLCLRVLGRNGNLEAARRRLRWPATTVVTALAVALGVLTVDRNRLFHSDEAVWRDVIAHRPRNARAWANLAKIYSDRKDAPRAMEYYRTSLQYDPKHIVSLLGLANQLRTVAGRPDQAENFFRRALELKMPDEHTYAANTGLGESLMDLNRFDEALKAYQKAYAIHPSAAGLVRLSRPLVRLGRGDEALERLDEALKLEPHLAMVYEGYASAMLQMGRTDEAVARYRQGLTACPASAALMNDLAWLLATNPNETYRDGSEALRLAQASCRQQPGDPMAMDTLAAAYAETGQFEQAVATQTQAMDLLRAGGGSGSAGEFQKRLDLYRGHRPYRTAPTTQPATSSAPAMR